MFVDRHERERFFAWSEIVERAEAQAVDLVARGVRPGDRVGIALPTSPEFAVAFFATAFAGAAPAPCPPPPRFATRAEVVASLETRRRAADWRLLISESAYQDAFPGFVQSAVAAPHSGEVHEPGDPREPSDLALVQFSSGTTAVPKAVALSNRAVVEQLDLLDSLFADLPQRRKLVGVSWLPLHHDLGLVGFFLAAARRPARLVLLAPELFAARPAHWLRAISRHGDAGDVGVVSAAPSSGYAHAALQARDEDLRGVDLSAWSIAWNGAETVAPRAIDAFVDRFAPYGFDRQAMTPVYGLAEATLAVTIPPLGRGPRVVERDGRALVALGPPLPGFRIELRGPARDRVHIAGPSLFECYWNDDASTAAVLDQGWLDTGDVGFLDAGELVLTGRAKDVLVLRGANFSPEVIEEAAARAPGVAPGAAAATAGLAEDALEEELTVFVERDREASEAAVAMLAEVVTREVVRATGLRPARVVVLEPGKLPRTSSGKVQRSALRKLGSGSNAGR